MPLSLVQKGVKKKIVRIVCKSDLQDFLNNLGFQVGKELRILEEERGNLLVLLQGAQIAIGKDMANRIYVSEA